MTVGKEPIVFWETSKLRGEIQAREGVQVLERFLMEDEGVPDQKRHEIAVLEDRRSTAFGICLFWEMICYPGTQCDDMVSLQREHGESGWR
jgi:hypothetical protein